MKVAIDLDGTLGDHPVQLIALANTLIRGGADVFVLTAAAGELPAPARPAEVGRRLYQLGASHLRAVCLETSEKAAYCVQHGVDILIDDTPFSNLGNTVQLIPGGKLARLLVY